MQQLNVAQINSALFGHNLRAKRLSADISDIGGGQPFQPLYKGMPDVGFALRNPVTGNVTRWRVAGELRSNDADNELQGWCLVPTPESIERQPILEGYCMTVFND